MRHNLARTPFAGEAGTSTVRTRPRHPPSPPVRAGGGRLVGELPPATNHPVRPWRAWTVPAVEADQHRLLPWPPLPPGNRRRPAPPPAWPPFGRPTGGSRPPHGNRVEPARPALAGLDGACR